MWTRPLGNNEVIILLDVGSLSQQPCHRLNPEARRILTQMVFWANEIQDNYWVMSNDYR